MKNKFLFLVMLALLVVAGCGNTNDTSNEAAAPSEEAEGTETTEGSVDLGLIEHGKLSFAMSGLYPPLNFKKDGELTGFDVEVGKEIADRIGLEANPVTNPWETIIQGLKANKYDAIIGSMSITEERDEQIDFTNPYYLSGAQIFVQVGNEEIKSAEDLTGKVIGVIQSSTWKDMAEEYSDQIKAYPSDVNALQDLQLGRVDAVITDRIVGLSAKNDKGLEIQPVGELLNKDRVAVAVQEGNTALAEAINEAIASMLEDGTYEEISMKWFNENIMAE